MRGVDLGTGLDAGRRDGAKARRDEALADPDTLILGGGDGERLRRAQAGFFQLAALIGAAHDGIVKNDDLAALLLILHDEMAGAMASAIPPAAMRH